jgi:ring-1,2-phenylacetyl-CoA epoxidase subunit PaaE
MPPVTMSDTFHTLKIASARKLEGDAIEIVFAVPDAAQDAFAFKPGQYVAVRAMIDGVEQRRSYSICSGRRGPLRIGIKRVAGGAFSNWANDQLKAGNTLDVAPPRGRFVLPAGFIAPRHLLMLAAGAGITPLLGMTTEALEEEASTRVTLLYATRTLQQAMFLDALEDLKDKYPARLDVIRVLSGAGEAEIPLLAGRMTGEKLKAFAEQRIDIRSVNHAFLCGPGSFIKETRNALFELGLVREAVHHEFFAGRTGALPVPGALAVVAPKPEAVRAAGAIDAVAVLDGQRHPFVLEPGQHVLDAALKAGIKAPYSCTGGMCSTCRARVVDGKVTMTVNYSLEPWEIERGFVLTCQAIAKTPNLTIDYDAM